MYLITALYKISKDNLIKHKWNWKFPNGNKLIVVKYKAAVSHYYSLPLSYRN